MTNDQLPMTNTERRTTSRERKQAGAPTLEPKNPGSSARSLTVAARKDAWNWIV
jgi:hypothetical protein